MPLVCTPPPVWGANVGAFPPVAGLSQGAWVGALHRAVAAAAPTETGSAICGFQLRRILPGFDVTLTISWAGHPDLDIRVECLVRAVGWSVGGGDSVLSWPSGDNQAGGPEQAYISRRSAVEIGGQVVTEDLIVSVGSGWYSPAQDTPGFYAHCNVSLSDGRQLDFDLHPGMQTSGVTSTEVTFAIPFAAPLHIL